MNYWLIKSEPNTYSWDDFVKLGRDHWDGVRNYQARNNMKEMKEGDLALFYHSVNEKAVVGVAQVVREYYQDPTTEDDRWVVVDLVPVERLKRPVTLEQIKSDDRLSNMVLVRNSRLSVQPVKLEEFDLIVGMNNA
ncbi:MAG: EVE domain-containing protein [Cyclobacteriaceae bacterium]